MNKQNVVYPRSGILPDNRKERTFDMHCNMDEPRKHAKLKKPDKKRPYIVQFHLFEISGSANARTLKDE